MRTGRKWQVGVVCVVLMALLTPAALAVDFAGGGEFTVDYVLDDWNNIYDATVSFEAGSSLPDGGWLLSVEGAVVNINNCVFGAGSVLYVGSDANSDPSLSAPVVTFQGTDFAIGGVPIGPGSVSGDDLDGKVLSGKYANGDSFEVFMYVLWELSVILEEPGGPSVIDVVVDIKPDSADNTINLGSMGVIPVGIFSTADFDATQVDPWTVELAGAGVAVRGKGSKLLSSAKDLNGDGLLDLEVKVETENLDPGSFQDGAANLTGQTYDGLEIQGQDSITIVPE